jgi:hypothetical protein
LQSAEVALEVLPLKVVEVVEEQVLDIGMISALHLEIPTVWRLVREELVL